MEYYFTPNVDVTLESVYGPTGKKYDTLGICSRVPIPDPLRMEPARFVFSDLVDLEEGQPCKCWREPEPRLLVLSLERDIDHFMVRANITNCECGFLSKHYVLRMHFVLGKKSVYADLHIHNWFDAEDNIEVLEHLEESYLVDRLDDPQSIEYHACIDDFEDVIHLDKKLRFDV